LGWFLLWYIVNFYPQADLARRQMGVIKWELLAGRKTLNKAASNWCFESTRCGAGSQCHRMVQRCGLCGKEVLDFNRVLCHPAAVTTARVRASIFNRHEITNRTEKQAAARLAA
jgi:hypothetical protein